MWWQLRRTFLRVVNMHNLVSFLVAEKIELHSKTTSTKCSLDFLTFAFLLLTNRFFWLFAKFPHWKDSTSTSSRATPSADDVPPSVTFVAARSRSSDEQTESSDWSDALRSSRTSTVTTRPAEEGATPSRRRWAAILWPSLTFAARWPEGWRSWSASGPREALPEEWPPRGTRRASLTSTSTLVTAMTRASTLTCLASSRCRSSCWTASCSQSRGDPEASAREWTLQSAMTATAVATRSMKKMSGGSGSIPVRRNRNVAVGGRRFGRTGWSNELRPLSRLPKLGWKEIGKQSLKSYKN